MINNEKELRAHDQEEDFLVELVVQGRKLRPVPERSLVENSGFFRNVLNKMQQQEEEVAAAAAAKDEEDDYIVLTLNEDCWGQQQQQQHNHQKTYNSDPLSKISFETMNAIVDYFHPQQKGKN